MNYFLPKDVGVTDEERDIISNGLTDISCQGVYNTMIEKDISSIRNNI